jgi:hypothetical protein
MRILISSLAFAALAGLAGCDEVDEAAEDVGDVFDGDEDGGGGGGGADDDDTDFDDDLDLPGGGGPGPVGPIPGRPGDEIDDPVGGGGGGGGGDGDVDDDDDDDDIDDDDDHGDQDCYRCPDDAGHFFADFRPLNDSDIEGHTLISVTNQGLLVWAHVEGLEPQRPMGQAVYGFFNQTESVCPTPADDSDRDGWITRQELSERTGRVLLDLSPYPVSSATGEVGYDVMFPVAYTCPLTTRAVVLFGGMRNGVWDPDLVVGCGKLHPATDEELESLGVDVDGQD